MDPVMWDCETAHVGVTLSNFQRQMPGDLYGGRQRMTRGEPWLTHDRRTARPAQSVRRVTARRAAGLLPGLALVSVLALLPLVMSVCANL